MLKLIDKTIKWLEANYWLSYLITLLLAILIFYISSKSFEKGAPLPEFPLKSLLYHLLIFFLFSFFLLISMAKGNKRKNLLIIGAIIIGVLYGVSDEFHQLFVPNRACTFEDILTDSIGVLSAGVLYVVKLRRT